MSSSNTLLPTKGLHNYIRVVEGLDPNFRVEEWQAGILTWVLEDGSLDGDGLGQGPFPKLEILLRDIEDFKAGRSRTELPCCAAFRLFLSLKDRSDIYGETLNILLIQEEAQRISERYKPLCVLITNLDPFIIVKVVANPGAPAYGIVVNTKTQVVVWGAETPCTSYWNVTGVVEKI